MSLLTANGNGGSVPADYDALSSRQMRSILAVLERCEGLPDGEDFKVGIVEAIANFFQVRDVTFFYGRTYSEIFDDPKPHLTGATATLLPAYREQWQDKDVFAMPRVRAALTTRGFTTLEDLPRLPGPQQSYVVDYLRPNHMTTASSIHLKLADGEALIGMFDQVRGWDDTDLLAIRLLARQLRARTQSVSVASAPVDVLATLTPRQADVAALVSDGLSNAEIAERLFLSELSIKKYVSRIFDITGYRNRSELATAWLRRGRATRGQAS